MGVVDQEPTELWILTLRGVDPEPTGVWTLDVKTLTPGSVEPDPKGKSGP